MAYAASGAHYTSRGFLAVSTGALEIHLKYLRRIINAHLKLFNFYYTGSRVRLSCRMQRLRKYILLFLLHPVYILIYSAGTDLVPVDQHTTATPYPIRPYHTQHRTSTRVTTAVAAAASTPGWTTTWSAIAV